MKQPTIDKAKRELVTAMVAALGDEYLIVAGAEPYQVSKRVTAALKEGWSLAGGPFGTSILGLGASGNSAQLPMTAQAVVRTAATISRRVGDAVDTSLNSLDLQQLADPRKGDASWALFKEAEAGLIRALGVAIGRTSAAGTDRCPEMAAAYMRDVVIAVYGEQ